jgi:hypothetical protein
MFGVLSGELANNIGPGSMGFYCPSQTKQKGSAEQTHQFIKFIHLPIYWQLFSSLEYFVILIRIRQASERVFLAILLGHQESDVKKRSKNQHVQWRLELVLLSLFVA